MTGAAILNLPLVDPPLSRQEYATLAHEVTLRDDEARRELGYRPVISVEEGSQELRQPPWLQE